MSKAVGFFKNIILTNKGKELLLASNNNIDNSLEFTICKFGDGRYTEDEVLTATDIKNAWKTQNINTVRIDNSESDPKLIIEITFTNKDMQEPKVLNELGIFAKDKQNETHLFAYSLSNIENGEEIEIENDYPTTFKISIISKISNNTNVTNIIDPDGFLTKEVIELLKENIRNIAFRKIKGTLNAGERTITISTDNLMPLSERLVLNIEGEIYFLDRDYTIDIKSNTINLKEPYSFDKDSMYEIIDPLPATYVKEQINEFIEEFKKLVSDSKLDFEKLKEKISLEFENRVDEFYRDLDSYIEQNRENLKGLSIKSITANGTDLSGGNRYNVVREDGTVIGEIVAPKGLQGNGVANIEFVRIDENGDTEYRFVLDNGSKTSTFILPKGAKGDPFKIVKVYRSILEMNADISNREIHVGDMVAIDTGSVEDEDTGKLFTRTNEGFSYLLDLSGATGIQGPEGPKGNDGKNGLSVKDVVANGTDENGGNKYNVIREDNTVIGEIITPASNIDKVSKSGDTMTGLLNANGGIEINGNKVYNEGFKPTAADVGAVDVRDLGTYNLGGNLPSVDGTNTLTVAIPTLNGTLNLTFKLRLGSIYSYTNVTGYEEYAISILATEGNTNIQSSSIVPIYNSTAGRFFTFGALRRDSSNVYIDVYYLGDYNPIFVQTTYVGGSYDRWVSYNAYKEITVRDVRRTEDIKKVGTRYDVYTTRNIREYCPYRVGDILTTTLPDNPAVTWVGTTWQKIEGKYLKGTSGISNAKQTGGSNTKTLSVANMPAHNHTATQPPHLHTQPPHTHTYSASATEPYGGYYGSGGAYPVSNRISSSAGGENTGSAQPVITVGNTGSGTPFNIEPEYYLVNFWLRLS